MARIILVEEKNPTEIKISTESKWICRCGLSKNKPFCDSSHKQTQDEAEETLYKYADGKRIVVKISEASKI